MHKTPPSPARHHTLEMSAASCQMPGLTIISTAPRCQMLPLLAATNAATQQHSVETFIGGAGGGNTSTLERKAHLQCLQQQQQQQQQHQMKNLQTSLATATITSPATRCCNILGGVVSSAGINVNNMSQQQQQHHHQQQQQQQQQLTGMPQVVSGSTVGYYDAYGAAPASSLNMTGSLSRRTHMTTQHQPALNHEFVGVETLDILQGVAPGKYQNCYYKLTNHKHLKECYALKY